MCVINQASNVECTQRVLQWRTGKDFPRFILILSKLGFECVYCGLHLLWPCGYLTMYQRFSFILKQTRICLRRISVLRVLPCSGTEFVALYSTFTPSMTDILKALVGLNSAHNTEHTLFHIIHHTSPSSDRSCESRNYQVHRPVVWLSTNRKGRVGLNCKWSCMVV
jgi:hypothetical protein